MFGFSLRTFNILRFPNFLSSKFLIILFLNPENLILLIIFQIHFVVFKILYSYFIAVPRSENEEQATQLGPFLPSVYFLREAFFRH